MRFIFIFSILVTLFNFSNAQETRQVSNAMRVECLTETLERIREPQLTQIRIETEGSTSVQKCEIYIPSIDVVLTPVSARINGKDLWLIRSSSVAAQENVLAWEFSKTDNKLLLYPSGWRDASQLELEFQLVIGDTAQVKQNESYKIEVDIRSGADLFQAIAAGRGDQVSFR